MSQTPTGPKPDSGARADADDVPPDHLAVNPRSPHYDADLLARGIGISFCGQRKRNVEEYCVSEGWIKVAAGKTVDRRGNPLLLRRKGPVEAWFEDLGEDAPRRTAGNADG